MKHIEVAAAVIVRDGKIFAVQRGHGQFKDGWEFPGGKIEPGETKEEALIREIREELETDIKITSFIGTVEHDYPDFHIAMHCFICQLLSEKLKLTEHENALWLDKYNFESIAWLPADVHILGKIKKYMNWQVN